ncbi:MAG: hypothetical protein V4717_04030 [Bacteroidota bacterium]
MRFQLFLCELCVQPGGFGSKSPELKPEKAQRKTRQSTQAPLRTPLE